MRSLLIYNPVSGKEESRAERLGNIVSSLSTRGDELMVYQTTGSKDGERYIRELQDLNFDRVVCSGGDGTMHEVINGVLKRHWDVPVGYVPAGSTNDYAKNLGITPATALSCIEEGETGSIDVGCFNGEYFNYVAAFGLFTNVSFATPQDLKNNLGYFAYLLEGIKQLTDVSPKHIRFCADGEWKEGDMLLGMITNSFSIAGVQNFKSSQVQLNDGKFEYLFIKFPKNIVELQVIIGLLISAKIDEKYMCYGHFSAMELESEPMEWTVDGENGGVQEHADIRILPEAVRIIRKKQEEPK